MKYTACKSRCRQESIIQGNKYRFTVLTSRLLRIEYAENGCFEDRPSQFACNRDFETPPYSICETSAGLEIHTKQLDVFYDKNHFSPGGLFIKVRSACRGIYSTWHYGDDLTENLGGTARTLDQADGAIPLDPGIQSRLQGYSVLDDSHTMLIREDGWAEARQDGTTDLYFFGYGYDYQQCLQDFFYLSGRTPLLPRYALGNWWSRFFKYSDKTYQELMDHFQREGIPLSVAVVDMDWHITDVAPEDGKGWTGYTWNRELFPQPAEFLSNLHSRNLKVTLNLHPAEGIQPHEEQYPAAAKQMGKNPDDRQPILFDFCNPNFVRTYFHCLIKPLEQGGVDFWWIDWQQGTASRTPGGDPLWLLNYYHFWESTEAQKRPMIFSRYAGPGSHRYPIGFSGDSIISWSSLQFQPYFTATATNIGYGWWSHDIGGHCGGKRDDELMVRWVQFGVFSPIMRLHSTSNLFNGKEPWKFSQPACNIIKDFLCLRHQLVPYLYTLNWLCHTQNQLPIRPMYYHAPEQDAAYEVPNQYELGANLIVAPITAPAKPALGLGCATVWLPDQTYFDFFSGLCYRGGRKMSMYRPLDSIPVLAPAGAIIPLTEELEATHNGVNLPEQLELKIFAGKDGAFELYEDDGESMDYQSGAYTTTKYEFSWSNAEFHIKPGVDYHTIRPTKRQYTLCFVGIKNTESIEVISNTAVVPHIKIYNDYQNILTIKLAPVSSSDIVLVRFRCHPEIALNHIEQRIFNLVDAMRISYELKEKIYHCITDKRSPEHSICELQTMDVPTDVLGALTEILFAQ